MEPSDHIAALLQEARAACGPAAWPRVEAVVEALVGLYGDGLSRMLSQLDDDTRRRLAADELVGSLLTLHGLHPRSVEERLRDALSEVRERIGRVELLTIHDGVVRLIAPPQLRPVLERLVQEAAPELRGVELEAPLLQIRPRP